MTQIIVSPSKEQIASFGILAHVDEHERGRIMALPDNYRASAIRNIEKSIKKWRGRK